ncbi:MAG: di-trans,poly-cis-decaprenylcistransferase [Oscillospiraceae bacterium]|nr:di-trans,poly-cis-decaprenylcistransferase [Oscillospiraceae bacterium]MCD8255502.1 di-trans,poly-cis-decaprenylcistransferase [Oscillospiraceae bacterium]
MALFSKKEAERSAERVVPRHIAIILDGNGRWAKKRGLPRTAGHAVGAETMRKIATYCRDIGVKYLSLYVFSTENWNRPPEEVAELMRLLEKYLYEAIEDMEKNHLRIVIFGDKSRLSPKIRSLIERTDEISSHIEGFQVNLCLNYGGRDEIVRAARRYAQDVAEGRANDIDEAGFAQYLYSAGLPDPELLIRPGGEMRTSNFLMWQLAYSEMYFVDTLWPDFTPHDIDKAIDEYLRRDRRFGKVKE